MEFDIRDKKLFGCKVVGNLPEVVIPDGVEEICEKAFARV